MYIKGIGIIKKEKAMRILTRDGKEAVKKWRYHSGRAWRNV